MNRRLLLGWRRLRRFFIDTPNVRLLLGFIAVLVVASYALPNTPGLSRLRDGIECTRLSNPPGGNQRSLLAYESNRQELELEVRVLNESEDLVGDPVILPDESLLIRVIFYNEDQGPIYLYFRENEEVVRPFDKANPPADTAGVIFVIEYLDQPSGNPFRNDPGRLPFPPKQTYNLEDIYVIQSNHRCSLDFEFTRNQMERMNLVAGKYQVRVYYYNRFSGQPQHAADATATPMFEDQGVWTGITESLPVQFTIEGSTSP